MGMAVNRRWLALSSSATPGLSAIRKLCIGRLRWAHHRRCTNRAFCRRFMEFRSYHRLFGNNYWDADGLATIQPEPTRRSELVLETSIGLLSSTEDHADSDRRTLAGSHRFVSPATL